MTTSDHLRYTSAPDRRESLAKYVEEQGYCTIAELSALFSVSEMTVRRDVARLVADGRVRSFHGGVSSFGPQDLTGSEYTHRAVTRGDIKWSLAQRARDMIDGGSVIGLDAGTTVASLAHQLPDSGRLKVVTASLPAISALATNSGVEVTSLGGVLHPESLSFAGPSTLAAIANLHLGTLFLAASGLNDRGVYCGNDFDALTKRSLIEAADRVILLADSSKFETAAMAKVCGWDAVDVLIVDDALDPGTRVMVADHGVDVVLVDTPDSASAN